MVSAVFGFILGLVIGSYSQATAERIIKGKSLRGRSYCAHCKKQLQWYDLFPVLSYLFLLGKCRYCHRSIPLTDFLVELCLGVILGLVFWTSLSNEAINQLLLFKLSQQSVIILFELIFKSFVVCILAVIFWVDLKSGLIPDRITYPAIFISSLYLLISSGLKSWFFYWDFLQNPLAKYLMSSGSGYLTDHLIRIWTPVFWTIGVGFAAAGFFILLILITRGRGMGWGDVKYILFLGLALGFPNLLLATLLAFLTGAFFSLILIVIKRKHFGQTIPFGPFLSLGAVFSLIWGNQIINWYLLVFK